MDRASPAGQELLYLGADGLICVAGTKGCEQNRLLAVRHMRQELLTNLFSEFHARRIAYNRVSPPERADIEIEAAAVVVGCLGNGLFGRRRPSAASRQ